ncbi:ion channel [Pseudonocardia nigra]|uniref:ion channel n=1 Tax=Pseudonocardia nigra TaxID=1921578 RepID=UPI001C5E067F|nr:ion channel [Pseudonocardia nigra]
MPILLQRFWTLLNRLHGWRLPLLVAAVVFGTSWLAMWLVEPAGSEIASPGTYWWYFLVTAATVGYGDVYPSTPAGRVVGGYVIVGGIVTLTILFTRLASYLETVRGKRVKGLAQLDVGGHVVILGYVPRRTERMVDELSVEAEHPLVLCAWDDDVADDPMVQRPEVSFVRGDLTSRDVMTRACVAAAEAVIVDGRDDNESLAIALAVDHANPDLHIVVALRDMERREQLHFVNPAIQCVQWAMPNLITDETLDPGIAQVYTDLMSGRTGGNTYSVPVPAPLAGRSFGECQTWFGERFGATLIAVRGSGGLAVSPGWGSPVEDGATLYYLARQRLDRAELTRGARR